MVFMFLGLILEDKLHVATHIHTTSPILYTEVGVTFRITWLHSTFHFSSTDCSVHMELFELYRDREFT
jgi:hypothetical protein